jgi:2-polyprenyl-3-methyl-5-hydroxy-6-metoxy-1,4-benzoquinol methylase
MEVITSKCEQMTEEEIRPDNLKDGQKERFLRDVEKLLTHKENFVEVSCPACLVNDSHFEFSKYDMNYNRCEQCDTLYVSPRPTPEILEEFYSTSENYEYWNKYIFPASEKARREKIFRPRAEKIAKICDDNNVQGDGLLEVGSGFGTFCEEIGRLNIFDKVIAVEPTPGLAATCRAKGVEVIEKPIEEVQLDNERVDLIASFEVIEHLFEPKGFVKACWELLAPGGVIVITCPNIDGFDLSQLGKVSENIDVEHINYFNPKSIEHLMRNSGFEMIELSTPGKLDAELVRKKVLSGDFDVADQPFLNKVLMTDWESLGAKFQTFLSENGLSSHMWYVGKKPR